MALRSDCIPRGWQPHSYTANHCGHFVGYAFRPGQKRRLISQGAGASGLLWPKRSAARIGPPHDFHWFLRRVIELLFPRAAVRPGENDSSLDPDNLLRIEEADSKQPVQHLAGEDRDLSHIGRLKAGHQFEGFEPVGVAGDRGLGVALGSILHVVGLGRAVTV